MKTYAKLFIVGTLVWVALWFAFPKWRKFLEVWALIPGVPP